MNELRLLAFVLLIVLIGCAKKKPENFLIGGQWKTNYNPKYGWWNRETFAFLNDSIVDTKHSPYFKYDSTESPRYLLTPTEYFGTKTRYKIEGDCLKVYDLNEHKWRRGEKVMKLTEDTLVLKRFDDSVKTFVKKRYDISRKKHFDRIVLSSFPGWSGPSIKIIIDQDGGAFMRVLDQRGEGFYKASISKDQYKLVEENFLRIDQTKLKPVYFNMGTDQDQYSITFCSGNKIRISVYDRGPCGPDELIWAYPDLEYLYLNLDLKEEERLEVPSYVHMALKWFEFDGEELTLSDSESFLLSWYLKNGREVETDFPIKYKGESYAFYAVKDLLKERNNLDKYLIKIESDGRLFRFYEPGKKTYIIDIGFNYLNQNYFVFKKRMFIWRNIIGSIF